MNRYLGVALCLTSAISPAAAGAGDGVDVRTANGWSAALPDGAYKRMQRTPHGNAPLASNDVIVSGQFVSQHMTGDWMAKQVDGKRVGIGSFTRGAGAWTSTYPDGTRLAAGPYVDDRPHGDWIFYHRSGRIAAQGHMEHGVRSGPWRFFYDDEAHTPLASGPFDHGEASGTWQHYDTNGGLLATARAAPRELTLAATRDNTGVAYEHARAVPTGTSRVDAYSSGGERLYVFHDRKHVENSEVILDASGNRLRATSGAWTTSVCNWTADEKAQVKRGGAAIILHLLDHVHDIQETCAAAAPLPAGRAKQIERTLAARSRVRAKTPAFMAAYEANLDTDLVRMLADHMDGGFVWPQVDGLFGAVYATLPGYTTK